MRAQVSIELFFALSFFLVLLFWLGNFVAVVKANSSPLVVQAQAISSKVVSLADAACVLNEEVSVELGCVVGEKMLSPYRLSFSGSQATVSSLFGSVSRASSFCDFSPGFVDISCSSSTVLCLKREGNVVKFSSGGCLP